MRVVVEAQCSATKEAVVAACQAGNLTPWPLKADEELIRSQAELILDAFQALKAGGRMLVCCNSLAVEETDGLMTHVLHMLKGEAILLEEPHGSCRSEIDRLSVVMKQWGVERAHQGWRLLPDLAFQSPQYFSLFQKV